MILRRELNVYTALVVVVAVLLALSACTAASPAAPTPAGAAKAIPVKFGLLQSSLSSTFLHDIAVSGGHYKNNGLELTVTNYKSGQGTAGLEELLRGNTDCYLGTPVEMARVASAEVDKGQQPSLVIIAAGNIYNTNLVLRGDLPYNNIQDLKGRSIAASSLGSSHLVILRHYLNQQKLTIESVGMQIVPVAGENMPPALLSKQIDGFIHSEPTTALALLKGGAKVIISGKAWGEAGSTPNSTLIVRRDWLSKNSDTAKRLVKALDDASKAYDKGNKAEMIKTFAKAQNVEEEVMASAWDRLDPRLQPLKQMAEAFKNVNGTAMVERGEASAKLKFDEMFDLSYALP